MNTRLLRWGNALVLLLVVAILIGAIYLVIPHQPRKCATLIGCANPPGFLSTLKAMPTYTPGPSPTMAPCHWEGSFCIPGVEAPPAEQPGKLRPVGPGYPYDVHA